MVVPSRSIQLANALGTISNQLCAVGLGPVNLGRLAKHMLKLRQLGAEMAYNVPRLGPGGGYAHKATGSIECGDSLSIAKAARKPVLKQRLLTLASWCQSRASGEHDDETTLTMLERKALEIRQNVNKAGWKAVADAHPPKNDSATTP